METKTETTTEEIIATAIAAVTPEDIERFKPEEVEGVNAADFDGLIIDIPEELINLYVASQLATERLMAAKATSCHSSLKSLHEAIGLAIEPLNKEPSTEDVGTAMKKVLEGLKELPDYEYDQQDVLIAEAYEEQFEEFLVSNEEFQKLLFSGTSESLSGSLLGGSVSVKTYILPEWKLGTKKMDSGSGCGCAICSLIGAVRSSR